MIAFGTRSYPFNITNGAGLINMPPLHAPFITGEYDIAKGSTITLDLPSTSTHNYQQIKAAIWWPEEESVHSDIDLILLTPAGVPVESSTTTNGVFEKVKRVGAPYIGSGVWQIQIRRNNHSQDNKIGFQTVYVAAYLVP